jgi:hypothetical protein
MYDKLPWELGYPQWEEFDNILPFVIGQINKKRERDKEIADEYEKQKKAAGVS